jgi:hypothetical protein
VVLVRTLSTLRRGPAGHARTATALAAVGALMISGGLVMLAAAPTATAGGPDPKVVVCKYVGTPPGALHHVVVVSENSLNNTPYVAPPDGDSWTDAQGQTDEGSVAIRYAKDDEQAEDVSLKECPGYVQEIPVPAMPSTTDPCNPPEVASNIAFVVPADTAQLDYTLLGNGDVTVAPKPGFVFRGNTQVVTFQLPADSNVPCSTTVTIDPPGTPSTTDPCGPANIAFNVPADTAQLDYTLLGNGDVTAAPKPGFVFSGNSQLITFTLPADSGTPCPLGVEEIAPEVTFISPDCANLDGADWSGNLKEIVDYAVSGTPGLGESITVTATVKPALADQYAFPGGFDTSIDHTYPTLAELECVLGEESVVPSPRPEENPPVVLGTEAAVPTQVNAGMATLPTTGSPTNLLLAQLMVAGGLLLLVAGGWAGLGRGLQGKHHR